MKYLIFFALLLAFSCSVEKNSNEVQKEVQISDNQVNQVVAELLGKHNKSQQFRIESGVRNLANFWKESDGDYDTFRAFCIESFVSDSIELYNLFNSLSIHYESLNGYMNEIILGFKYPLDVVSADKPTILDSKFAAYDPTSHINEDFFKNKIAMITILNFPHYSVNQKNEYSKYWTRENWAFAAAGDIFSSRVPGDLSRRQSEVSSEADNYISNYNIYMGSVIDSSGNKHFSDDKVLISHWNLRDELKSQYAEPDGLAKQELIYEIMLDIINQDIPQVVINNGEYIWSPQNDKVFSGGTEIKIEKENNTRYEMILNQFKINREIDEFNPVYNTFIKRSFDKSMQMTQEEVEALFITLLSSETANNVANLVKQRLGRELRPYDIWYDGFKSRSTISEEKLSNITKSKYPNVQAFQNDLDGILVKYGFSEERASYLADKIVVDPSTGAGHAWGAQRKGSKAHLRSRIGKDGLDYKGYNIGLHEFGHNVEQTFSLYNVDYYLLNGVPNNAFTEAIAFMFQSRDMKILGLEEPNKDKEFLDALDTFWSAYEIMGVAVVDMRIWKWLYENPNATSEELKQAVVKIAIEVWNDYYSEAFGVKDSPILAIYSHTISYPLYLAAYPLGRLIQFQVEEHIQSKNFGEEIERITTIGKLTPNAWMQEAVGNELSVQPLLNKADSAVEKIRSN